MSLELQINEDIKKAMLAREKVKLESLRGVKAAILLFKTSGTQQEITDGDITKIMQKLVKQRKESAEIYASAGRSELADNELEEASFIEAYLPKQLSPEELEIKVTEIVTQTGATSMADIGKVMGLATKSLAGIADGRLISEMVKKLLSK